MSLSTDAQAIAGQLCQFARSNLVAHGTEFDENSPLADAGIDSFALVELLLHCERIFGVRVPLSHLTRDNLRTLGTLAGCIGELARQRVASPPAPR